MGYWAKVTQQSFRETVADIGWHPPLKAFVSIGAPVIVVAVTWALTHLLAAGAISGLGFAITMALCRFVWGLVTIPPRLAAEREAEVAKIRAAVPPANSSTQHIPVDHDMDLHIGQSYAVRTTLGAFVLTLPKLSTTQTGQHIQVFDLDNNASVNHVRIKCSADDQLAFYASNVDELTLDINGASCRIVSASGIWRAHPL